MKRSRGPVVSEKTILEVVLKTKQPKRSDILFDSITMPPWTQYVTMHDIEVLYWAATAKSLSGRSDKRRAAIKQVMEARGFKILAAGTNRITFKCLEDPSIVAKVAIDKVGLGDNEAEYKIQRKVFPMVTKMIQVCPTGVLGFAERVTPILTREEYNAYLPMVYLTLMDILGEYVMDDVGTDYFKNIGIRKGYGVVLLDYPYLYKLDGNKLICNAPTPTGPCMGEIDYDAGLNHLYCSKCGRQYLAADLEQDIQNSQVLIQYKKGGKRPMKVSITRGDEIIASSYNSDIIVNNTPQNAERRTTNTKIRASITRGDELIAGENITPKEDGSFTQMNCVSFPDPIYVEPVQEETKEPEPVVKAEPVKVEEPNPAPAVEPVIPKMEETSPIDMIMTSPPVIEEIPKVEEPPKAVETEDFPPSQWGAPKEHTVETEEPSRIKPYYVHPKEYDEDTGAVIIDSPKRAHNPYKNGGFLGND